jgi:magnesium-transporting ATPase (P-type)
MPEYIQNYNFNILYICILLIIYNIWKSNYEYINIILSKLYLLNYMSLMIVISIIGLYLFLKNLSFEVNIKYTIKYKY